MKVWNVIRFFPYKKMKAIGIKAFQLRDIQFGIAYWQFQILFQIIHPTVFNFCYRKITLILGAQSK